MKLRPHNCITCTYALLPRFAQRGHTLGLAERPQEQKLSDVASLLHFFPSRAHCTQVCPALEEGALTQERGAWAPWAAPPHLCATEEWQGFLGFSSQVRGSRAEAGDRSELKSSLSLWPLYPGQQKTVSGS